ncbi:MAG: PIN domain-containing protein [Desulfurococcales archaeon]|nr:PIN domain-containing protein [Desulfurococcales archaeon]
MKGLDTNILVYALAGEEEKRRTAEEILRDVIEDPGSYRIAAQVLAEMVYVISRKAPEVLEEAISMANLLSRVLEVLSYTHTEVLQAAGSPARYFWDRLLAYTYRNNGVDVILSEDEKPYKEIIRVENPFKKAQI